MKHPPKELEDNVGATFETQTDIMRDIFGTGCYGGGILRRNPDSAQKYAVIFSNEDGPYNDRFNESSDTFTYVGEDSGSGDQKIKRGNKYLKNAIDDNKPVYYFHSVSDEDGWKYRGIVQVIDFDWETRDGREVIEFTMQLSEESDIPSLSDIQQEPELDVIDKLRRISPTRFEEFVAEIWSRKGWSTLTTKQSNDRGIDVVAKRSFPYQKLVYIQVKRYSEDNKVGRGTIQKLASHTKSSKNVDELIVVTSSDFTSKAKQEANELNVKLVNGETLEEIIRVESARDIVGTYTE